MLFMLFVWACSISSPIHANEFIAPTSKYFKRTELTELQSGLKSVDCVYVINLDSRPEKWARVDSLLKTHGIRANRFSGVLGKKLSMSSRRELCGSYPIRLSAGEFGCLLSHLSVIHDAYNRGFNLIWVCEDDIAIIRNVKALPRYLRKLSQIDPTWDIFYTDVDSKNQLGQIIPSLDADFRPDYEHFDLEYYLEKTVVAKNIMLMRQRFGMYSFFISRSGMKKVLDYYNHMYLWTAIDIDIHYIPNLKEYSMTRDFVSIWYESPFSDIVHSQRQRFSLQP